MVNVTLPGPSRTIIVEPIEAPRPVPVPVTPAPSRTAPDREGAPDREPGPEREAPAPA